MKKFKYIFGMLLIVTLLLPSCKKDFLSLKPLGELSSVAVWKDPVLVQKFINNIYNGIGDPFDIDMVASYVDDAEFTPDWGVHDFNNSLLTPDLIPGWSQRRGPNTLDMRWASLYKNIRACNLFFENVNQVQFNDPTVKQGMIGEVHFLRAYLYQMLVALYGGVPLITKAYTLTDKYDVPRATYANSISFIVHDLDTAAALLPEVQAGDNIGRATKGAALALKSRVLLYAASDLHNKVSEFFPGYAHPELLGYTSGSQQARWQAAKDAAKAVIDMGIYSLAPAPGNSIASIGEAYSKIFISQSTSEDIFVKYYTPQSWKGSSGNPGRYNGPNGYHNWGNNTPTGDLVDAFEMADGTPFSWENPAEAAHPYKNRDPRFYADILYEGAKWRKRPADVQKIDPVGIIQVGTWQTWDAASGKEVNKYGLDMRKGPIESWNGTYTGYYVRKLIDPSVDGQYFAQGVPWRYIRYTEVLLNYSEASIELGQDAEARTYLNMIRHRVGMPDITASGAALLKSYRNERRVEMTYEQQRFFDVRRWGMGPSGYHPVHAVSVVYKLLPDHTTATVPTITPYVYQQRSWKNKAYFFPISRTEMEKNDKLIQNPGYE